MKRRLYPGRLAYVFLGLAALTLLTGLALGNREDQRNRIPLPLRMLSSLLVWAAALLFWRCAPAGESRKQAALAAAGMGFGSLGDFVMARVIPLPEHVIFGMLAFGAGHGCYIGATAGKLAERGQPVLRGLAPGALVSSGIAGVIGWRLMAYNPAKPVALNYAALAYALLLASMAGLGVALATRDPRYNTLALGGALFFLSDLILAGELFRDLFFPHIGDVIWLSYIAGQGLIVEALGAAYAQG